MLEEWPRSWCVKWAVDVGPISCPSLAVWPVSDAVLQAKRKTNWNLAIRGNRDFHFQNIPAAGLCYHMHVMWSLPSLERAKSEFQFYWDTVWNRAWLNEAEKIPTGKQRAQFLEMLFTHSYACVSRGSYPCQLIGQCLPHHWAVFSDFD